MTIKCNQWYTMGRTTFLQLITVTTNIVVFCEYLSQELPLLGTIKG